MELSQAQNPAPELDFLTVAEVASVLRVTTRTVYNHVRDGVIPSVRYGRSVRIPAHVVNRDPLPW